MSYDFALILPETAGDTFQTALDACSADQSPVPNPDPRLQAAVNDLVAAGAADEQTGWLSIWPLDIGPTCVSVPITYRDVEPHLQLLLQIAAARDLVLVDLSSSNAWWPGPGKPVSVQTGDDIRRGSVTLDELTGLVAALHDPDPFLILGLESEVFSQTYKLSENEYIVEYRAGDAEHHFTTTVGSGDEAAKLLWGWLNRSPGWDEGLEWERINL